MTQDSYWWIAGISALGVFLITLTKALWSPLSKIWKIRQRYKYGIKATSSPYVFAPDPHLYFNLPNDEKMPYKLHGFAVELTGNSDDPYEIIGVELRLNGVDLSAKILAGWSQSTELDKEIIPEQVKNAFSAVEMRLVHDKSLLSNSSNSNGFKLTKNKKVKFFTPIRIPIIAIAVTIPNSVTIVARTTEGDKTILSGQHLWTELKEIFDKWKHELLDPNYVCQITVHTTRKHMPLNSSLINTVNDKPIQFIEAMNNQPRDPIT